MLTKFSGVLIVIGILLMATPARIFSHALTADDASYMAHAFTIAFDADLDYSNESFDWAVDGPNGVRPAHPIGPGLAAAPVIALFSILDRFEGHPVIEDRTAYAGSRAILGFFVASAAALGGGLLALIAAIRVVSGSTTGLRIIVVSVLGSGVPFYALNRFTMSHSFEFLFLSLSILAGVQLVRSQKRRASAWFLLGLSSAMTVLIRPGNLPFLLLPLWAALALLNISGATGTRLNRHDAAVGTFAVSVFWLPTLWLQHHLYGSPVTLSYRLIAGSYWSGPDGLRQTLSAALERIDASRLLLLLFGAEFGLIWSSFVIIAGTGAAVAVARRTSHSRTAVRCAFIAVSGFMLVAPVISVFGAGQMGIDYGNRFLYPLVPPAAFALGLVLSSSSVLRQRRVAALLVAMSCIGVVSTAFYQSAGSTDRLLTHAPQENIFGEQASSARSYGRELVSEASRPQAWIRVLAVRTPGFLVIHSIQEETVYRIGDRLGVPQKRLEDGLRWSRRSDWLDVTVIVTTLSVLILTLIRASDPRRSSGSPISARWLL